MPLIELTNDDDYTHGTDLSPFLDEEQSRSTFRDALSSAFTDPEEFSRGELINVENHAKEQELRHYRRKKMYALAAVCLLILAMVILIPIIVVSSKKKDKSRLMVDPTLTPSVAVLDEADPFVPPKLQPLLLQGFTPEVLKPYASQEAFQEDLTVAAMDVVQGILRQNVQLIQDLQNRGLLSSTNEVDSSKSRANNRESDVFEGDTVQEDGTYVYAAYGERLVVWNRLDGTMVTEEQIPPPATAIQSVQITDHHVFIFGGGYGSDGHRWSGTEPPITQSDNATKLLVYTKPTEETPFLTLVGTQSLNGVLLSSRYLTETRTIHVVTGVDVNTGGCLGDPLTFFNFFPIGVKVNATQYYEEAQGMAKETLVPNFVARLSRELTENNQGQIPAVLKLNNWQTPQEQDRRKLSSFSQVTAFGSDEAIRSYVQILTINPENLPTDTFVVDSLQMNSTVIMSPSPHSTVHASGNNIVLSMERLDWDPTTQVSDQRLFLLQLKVNTAEASTSFHAASSLQGRLAGRYAMDIWGDDLRVASTSQGNVPVDSVFAVCGQPPEVGLLSWQEQDECTTTEGWLSCQDIVMGGCANVTKTDCPYSFACGDERDSGSTMENTVVVFGLSGENGEMSEKGRVQIGNDHDVIQSIHFGETFSYVITSHFGNDGPFYVLNMTDLTVTYRLQPAAMRGGVPATYLQPINKEGTLLVGIGQNSTGNGFHERDIGVSVSVFDVANPNAPTLLASQMLSGDDLLGNPISTAEYDAKAVQYTDNGLLIIPLTMYPSFGENHTAEHGGSSLPHEILHILSTGEIPVGFEGFVVLDVSNVRENGIQEVFRINHLGSSGFCQICSTNGFLPNHRSIWYEDDNSLMTLYSHKVFSTNLATLTENWSLNIATDEGADDNCCF